MKVLMLTDFYKPTIGGIEQHVENLSKHLAKRGHQVQVCTIKQRGVRSCEAHKSDVIVHRLDSLFRRIPLIHSDPAKKFHPPFCDSIVRTQLEQIAIEFKPDVVHSHDWILFSYLPLRTKIHAPIVHTLHHYGLICPKKTLLVKDYDSCENPSSTQCYSCHSSQGALKSLLTTTFLLRNQARIRSVDRFLAVSTFVQETHIRHLRIPRARIQVTPNFLDIDASKLSDLRLGFRTYNLPDNFILYVGALAAHKGVNLLLDAYKLANIDSALVLIGSKHPHFDYKRYHDGKKIFVFENAPRALVDKAYADCDFVVVPSLWAEPCPTVALEAMAHGKPIVASNVGGLPDLIENAKTGILVPPKNASSLAKAIKELTNANRILGKMSENTKKRVQLFKAEKVVSQIETVYKTLSKNQ